MRWMLRGNPRPDLSPPLGSRRLILRIAATTAEIQGEYPAHQGDLIVRFDGERSIEERDGCFRVTPQRMALADLSERFRGVRLDRKGALAGFQRIVHFP